MSRKEYRGIPGQPDLLYFISKPIVRKDRIGFRRRTSPRRGSHAIRKIGQIRLSQYFQRYVDASKVAIAYLVMGDNEQALKWLEKGFSERSTAMVWLKVDPAYDPLRSEPRFHALLTKVGFE